MSTRICVLGDSISSLSATYFLRRALPDAKITLIAVPSSQVHTSKGRYHFEEGLQSSILNSRSGREVLGLVRLLDLDSQVISADLVASGRRHIWLNGRVQHVPRLWHCIRYFVPFMLEPLWLRRKDNACESVASLARRRFSNSVRRDFAEPLTWGLYGLKSDKCSVKWSFPRIWHNESVYGSVFLGALAEIMLHAKRKSWLGLKAFDHLNAKICTGGRMYSFRGGLETLLTALRERIEDKKLERSHCPVQVIKDGDIKSIQSGTSPVVKLFDGREIHADFVLSALSGCELSRKVDSSYPNLAAALEDIRHQEVAVVNFGFSDFKLKWRAWRGATYLCPSSEPVYSVSVSSAAFPQHNTSTSEGRVTVHLPRRDGEDPIETAKDAIARHLGITPVPDEVSVRIWPMALYEETHDEKLRRIEEHTPSWLSIIGPSFRGQSVADSVAEARMEAEKIIGRLTGSGCQGPRLFTSDPTIASATN